MHARGQFKSSTQTITGDERARHSVFLPEKNKIPHTRSLFELWRALRFLNPMFHHGVSCLPKAMYFWGSWAHVTFAQQHSY